MRARCARLVVFAGLAAGLVMVSALVVRQGVSAQSLTYSSGQTVSPAFEGWYTNDDGSFTFLFGYMNRNWVEEINVPIGLENSIEPAGPDQGQPTHLLPRRNRFVFKVRVPKDFGQKELIWTLTTHGKTEKAYATLRTDYYIDDLVMASETGALGAGASSPEMRSNKAPVVKVEGEKTRTVKVGQPLSLVTLVTDDGIPKRRGLAAVFASGAIPPPEAAPQTGAAGAGSTAAAVVPPAAAPVLNRAALNPPSRITVGKSLGLHQMWFVYRGAGKVTFDPVQIRPWEDTRASGNSPWAPLWQPPPLPADGKFAAQATFAEPGTYVLRSRADDGSLVGDDTLTVTVTR